MDRPVRWDRLIWTVAVGWAGLPVPLLATAPALFQPLHEPSSAGPSAPLVLAGLAALAALALAPHATGARARAGAGAAPGGGTAHVAPARQRPHGTGEHDHEPADAHKDVLGDHTSQQQAHPKQE